MSQVKELEQLAHDALELPTQDRAKLAHILVASIDDRVEDASDAWDRELERRVKEIKEGNVTGIPAETVFAKLEKKYF